LAFASWGTSRFPGEPVQTGPVEFVAARILAGSAHPQRGDRDDHRARPDPSAGGRSRDLG